MSFPTAPEAMTADWIADKLGQPQGALKGFSAAAIGTAVVAPFAAATRSASAASAISASTTSDATTSFTAILACATVADDELFQVMLGWHLLKRKAVPRLQREQCEGL